MYSFCLEITSGVPQGSVLGPLLFNIYINDLTYFIKDSQLCNFADDNTIFASDFKLEGVISRLENEIQKTLVWFESNTYGGCKTIQISGYFHGFGL